jgi:hypothetical protein
MGEVLDRLEAWWIEKDFTPDYDACMAEARRLADTLKGKAP